MNFSNDAKLKNDQILLNLFKIKKKLYRVLLDVEKIVCEHDGGTSVKRTYNRSDKIEVPFCDIIAIEHSIEKKKNYIDEKPKEYGACATEGENEDDQGITDQKNLKANKSAVVRSPDIQVEVNSLCHYNELKKTPTKITTTSISSDVSKSQYLILIYAKRMKNSNNNHNKWTTKEVSLYNNSTNIIMEWYDRIRKRLVQAKRPKTILLFINPYGGKQNGARIYEKLCKPIFEIANMNVICILSQNAKQIHDIVMEQHLQLYDAICCLGGDGTFAELFNAVLRRTMRDLNMNELQPEYIPKPIIPIGIIPGGSTNTIAYCLHGTCDVVTATIHIILGQTRGLDLASVYNADGLIRFYASVCSYGYLGDIALDSERFRWMGPKRYDYSGYYGNITYLSTDLEANRMTEKKEATEPDKPDIDLKKHDVQWEHQETYTKSDDGDVDNEKSTTQCYVDCLKCSKSMMSLDSNISVPAPNTVTTTKPLTKYCSLSDILTNNDTAFKENEFDLTLYNILFNEEAERDLEKLKQLRQLPKIEDIENARDNTAYLNDDPDDDRPSTSAPIRHLHVTQSLSKSISSSASTSLSAVTHLSTSNIPLKSGSNSTNFILNNVKGKFFLVSCANISCSCDRSPNGWSKYSHLGDGYLDIILVRHTTFINNLRLLLAMTKRNGNISNLPFVELYRTKKFIFKGEQLTLNSVLDGKKSQWNCDGEVLHDTNVIVSSHCQLIDVFMRGPYPRKQRSDNKKTIKCCRF